jgi:hypothetical protein
MYQLDQPRITATVGPAPSTQPTTASTAPSTQHAPIVIKFGRYDDVLKKNVMVSTSQSPVIAKVSATILDTINKKPLDLRDRKVLDLDPAQVSSITITSDLAATTRPTSRPASKKDVSLRRRKQSLVLGPAAPTTGPATQATTQATTGPATTQATTMAATAPATQPVTKWETADHKPADDSKIDQLLTQFHPLRARKYIEKSATTQPTATYTVKATTEGPGGTPVNHYQITFTDPGDSGQVIGSYNGLTFEVDRFLLDRFSGDFLESSKPAGGLANDATLDPTGAPIGPH